MSIDRRIDLTLRPIDSAVDSSIGFERAVAWLAGAFGVLALTLSILGLYGVMSHFVRARRKDIGVRLALGATPRTIVRETMTKVLAVVAIGVGLGATVAFWLSGSIPSMLFNVAPGDAATLTVASFCLAVAALAAGWLPAQRAAAIQPAVVLRHD